MSLPELTEEQRAWYILQGYEIIDINEGRLWYMNGRVHRHDGPAIERSNGTWVWYLNGVWFRTIKEHRIAVKELMKNV